VKIFQRKIEDFECGYCGRKVVGNGYTNHVDVHPGDRAAECGGLMVPVFLEPDKNERKLTHRCVMCGHEKKNRVSEEDDFEALLGLSKRIVSVK
jgi:ribosomal protein L37AE/L43A